MAKTTRSQFPIPVVDDDEKAAERRRRRSTSMGGISALPEHLQHEVFSRVGDVKALFMFAATCRGWLCCFTGRAFLCQLLPGSHGEGSDHRARLLGVFVQDKCFKSCNKAMVQARMMTMAAPPPQERASSSSSALAPSFLPALGSPLGTAGRAITSFGGGGYDGTFDYAELLAARRGIVLLSLAPRTPQEMDDCHLFGVCNPITGHRYVLPPLKCRRTLVGRRLVGYAIITAADNDSSGNGTPPPAAARWTFSQLLVITQVDAVGAAYLHSYSAATRRWRAPTRCLDSCVFSLVDARSAVVHRGAAHWLCVDDGLLRRERAGAARGDGDDHQLYRLSFDVATAHVSLTRLPVRVGGKQLLFVNSDGKLAVASVYPVHVTIWTPPGGGAGDNDDDDNTAAAAVLWPRTSFRIAPPHHLHQRLCSFNNGSLFALFWGGGGGGGIFILDLDTKVMEEVPILAFDNKAAIGFLAGANKYLTCVPCEMDLVEFFTLQLGGIRERLIGANISEIESS